MSMDFTLVINDSPIRKNKEKKIKTHKAWKDEKDDIKKLIKQELRLSNAELDLLNIKRREISLDSGMVWVRGYSTDAVGAKVDKKTI